MIKKTVRQFYLLGVLVLIALFISSFANAQILTPMGMDSNGYFHIAGASDTLSNLTEASVSNLVTDLNNKLTVPSGSTSQYLNGIGTPTSFATAAYSTYQSLVSQTGTSAPTGTVLNNDFGATTFTWARTGTGVYTLTASSAVFTANKTAILMSNPSNFLNNFKYTVTSTTVITVQTATLSVISLLLTPGNADVLLSNTMLYVVVYP